MKRAVDIHLDLEKVLPKEVDAHFDSMVKVAAQKLDRDERFGCLYVEGGDVASKIDQNPILLIQLGQVDLSADIQQGPVLDETMEVHVDILVVVEQVGAHKDPAQLE